MAFDRAKCPMPECEAELYVNYTLSLPVYTDSTTDDLAQLTNAASMSWQVDCTEGHTVLLPIDHASDSSAFGEECFSCAPDGGESNVPVHHPDLERLEAVLGMHQVGVKCMEV